MSNKRHVANIQQPSTGSQSLKRFNGLSGPRIITPTGGKALDLRSLGVRFMVRGEDSGGLAAREINDLEQFV